MSTCELSVGDSIQTDGIYKLFLDSTVITANQPISPFRYIVLYNDTHASKPLIGFYDIGSSITMTKDDTISLTFD